MQLNVLAILCLSKPKFDSNMTVQLSPQAQHPICNISPDYNK